MAYNSRLSHECRTHACSRPCAFISISSPGWPWSPWCLASSAACTGAWSCSATRADPGRGDAARRRRAAAQCLIVAVRALWAGRPGLGTDTLARRAPGHGGPARRFLAFNLKLDNADAGADARWLAEQRADLVFVTEATPAWSQQLATLRLFEACARYTDSPFGLALFSRLPLKSCQVLELAGAASGYPYLRAELEDGTVLYGLHPPPPLGTQLALARDESLRQLAERVASEGPEVIVLGTSTARPIHRACRISSPPPGCA